MLINDLGGISLHPSEKFSGRAAIQTPFDEYNVGANLPQVSPCHQPSTLSPCRHPHCPTCATKDGHCACPMLHPWRGFFTVCMLQTGEEWHNYKASCSLHAFTHWPVMSEQQSNKSRATGS